MLYSRFLASLLAKHKRDSAADGRTHQPGPPTQFKDAANKADPIRQLDAQSYAFGATTSQPSDIVDSTFDTDSIDELLGPMEAIENPEWTQTMMSPGCVSLSHRSRLGSTYLIISSFTWPTNESDPYFNNDTTADDYQNPMPPQPAAREQ